MIRRPAGALATLVATSFLVFSAIYLAPGDPATFLMHGHAANPEALAAVRAQYHLDDPFFVQYGKWAAGLAHGDFGRSVQFRQPVGPLLASRLPTTLWLVGYAGLLIVMAGIGLGALSALRPGLVDRMVLAGTGVATATPPFVAAIVLISVFSVRLGWLPAFGNGSGLGGRLAHLTLPAVALACTLAGLLTRVTRAAMLEQLGREHVEAARSRGISGLTLIRRHVFRNALAPITTVAGTVVAGLLVSTSIVETAFGLSGIGQLLVGSVTVKDFPVVQAVSLLIVLAFVVANLLVDLVLPVIDPRLARGSTT